MRPHLQRSTKSIPRFYNQLFHWTFLDRISCINFIISLAILDTSYLNMHFFGTHTCLCRLQNCPSADFGVFKYAWAVTQKVWNEAENGVWGSRVLLLRHALPTSLLILRKKTRLFCSLTYWVSMTLRDQIRSDPGRICSSITAWDQALWWETGEFNSLSCLIPAVLALVSCL